MSCCLTGRVVEIGAGNGMNFAHYFGHYPAVVEEVVALEPEPYLRDKAERAGRDASVQVSLRNGVANRLPLEDAGFDAAVASTVPDPDAALAELRRVLKPDGELCFLEHIRSDRPRKARVQKRLDRSGVWPRVAGGCHSARDTVNAIAAAGFQIDRGRTLDVGPSWTYTSLHELGRARAPEPPRAAAAP